MARRPSKTKKPLREKHMLKEQRKIGSEVFDRSTLLVLSKMMNKGIFASLDFPISTGKEANVFRATTADGEYLAVKIYKIETSVFFRKMAYMEGDPRFGRIKYGETDIVYEFARKEFKNLSICEKTGVHAPKPIYLQKNILVMGFLGEAGLAYPTMHMIGPRDEKDLDLLLEDVRKLYKIGLVHADLSEFNIVLGKEPYLIDWGQGVITRHPNSEQFLERDVENILKYFAKHGYKKDLKKTLEWIRS